MNDIGLINQRLIVKIECPHCTAIIDFECMHDWTLEAIMPRQLTGSSVPYKIDQDFVIFTCNCGNTIKILYSKMLPELIYRDEIQLVYYNSDSKDGQIGYYAKNKYGLYICKVGQLNFRYATSKNEQMACVTWVIRDSNYKGLKIGYKLMDFLNSYVKKIGISTVVLDASDNYIEYWKLYGFSEKETLLDPAEIEGISIPLSHCNMIFKVK